MVTRGLGGSAASLLSMGLIDHVRALVVGGRRFVENSIAELEENLKISVMLISANGKELSKPIISNVSKVYKAASDIVIRAMPKTLIQRKAKKIKVTAKLRNKYNEQD